MNTRVLIVDDCPDIRSLYAHRFERSGAQVVTAHDGVTAIASVKSAAEENRPFDLIILDIRMPGINGNEAATAIRNAGYRGLIAACTAASTGEGMKESKQAGIDLYFSKATLKPALVEALLSQATVRAT